MRQRNLVTVLPLFFFALAACSRAPESSSLPPAPPGLRVVNGIVTTEYPHVVELTTARGSTCTGTAVSSSTLVTAGHCSAPGLPQAGAVRALKQRFKRWADGIDLSVVVFPAGTFAHHIGVITQAPRRNDAIVIVGFGQTDFVNDNDLDGRKRYGNNTLVGFADLTSTRGPITHKRDAGNYLHYRSPISTAGLRAGDDAMSGRGDSGGPILIGGKLAGVTSFGGTHEEITRLATVIDDPSPDATKLYEYDSNLFSRAAVNLMEEAVREDGAAIGGLTELKAALDRG